ncbi:MAG TPA: phosphate ABC transporter permease subunit PstC [Fibrobacteria bacterium]|nr:phosphate ABC transporter permease subunit PstC [Fibrobacteria bacterium]
MLVNVEEQGVTPELRKRFRPGEFLAEKIITAIAFISLTAILLICIFVFREAWPVFTGGPGKAPAEASQSVGLPETYGEEAAAPAAPEALEPETYGEEWVAVRTPEASVSGDGAAAPPLESERDHHEDRATLSNLLGSIWQPVSLEPKYGILPLAVGSLKVTLVALLFAVPIGVLAALYTSTFASKWAKEVMKPTIEIMAGFPSVVIGFFALIVLASLLQDLFGFQYRLNALVGGVAMAMAVIPIIYTLSEDALSAVPKVLTEASLALGASKWETALFVVLPAATPGIFAAVLLGMGRAFGETMIVLMATGNAALLSPDLAEPVRTLSATIGAEMAEVVFGDTHYTVLFLLGAILFTFSFTLNAVAEFLIRGRLMKRFKGA